MAAVADLVVSVAEVAVMVTDGFAGRFVGGVYVVAAPVVVVEEENEPHPDVHKVPFCTVVQFTCGLADGSF
jgi:hypothetical protein